MDMTYPAPSWTVDESESALSPTSRDLHRVGDGDPPPGGACRLCVATLAGDLHRHLG